MTRATSLWRTWALVNVLLAVLASAPTLAGPRISPRFFGQNAWMPALVGDDDRDGWLEEVLCGEAYDPPTNTTCSQADIYESRVKIMRYGGKTVNEQYDIALSPDQYLTMVKNIQANGMTPILQVPYDPGQSSIHDAAVRAAELVSYINITYRMGVTYWAIGNEPEHLYGLTAQQIAEAFRRIARAMKEVDPLILIAGPELAFYDDALMTELTHCPQDPNQNGPNDITGPIDNLATQWPPGVRRTPVYYVDILTFHTYPFGEERTRDDVITHARTAGKFADDLTALQKRVNACNSKHTRLASIPLTMAVTEMNLGWRNPGDTYTKTHDDGTITQETISGTNDYAGFGNAGFLAGQFWADVMSVGMHKGLAFITFWSAISGDFGYMDHDATTNTNLKLSTYYHFQLLAKHVRGEYAKLHNLTVNGLPDPDLVSGIKAFGSKDTHQIAVMILNQQSATTATALPYTVRLDTTPIVGSSTDLQIHIDAGVASEYSSPEHLSPESTVLLLFNAQGVLTQKFVYTVDDARLNQGPQPQ